MLGFLPNRLEYYKQALIHKSSTVIDDNGLAYNNERLEFLGDAILDSVIADLLFHYFNAKKEGFLTNTRSKIVQRETLNKLAIEIGLDKLVVFSTKSSSHNNYMYGNAFEALIGAIYLDQGYDKCKRFIEERIVSPYIDLDKLAQVDQNYKSKLIEWGQKNKYSISFELIEECQDEQCNPIFQTEVLVEGICGGTGTGYSKKESQQNASEVTLKKIKSSKEFRHQIVINKELHDAEVLENKEAETPELVIDNSETPAS